MPNPRSSSTLAAALLAGLMLAAPPFASAGSDAPANDAHGEHGGRHPGGGHHGHPGGPFLRELKSLDLSDAQRASIRTAMKASFEAGRSQHQALRELHHQLMTTPPTAANHGALVNRLADAEADAARDRVQRMAALKAEVYRTLTDAQQAQLTERLARLPARAPHGEKTGWKPR